MGRLKFYYGTMGCSKTANALMTRFQYQDRGQIVWLIKPATDTRDDTVDANGITHSIIKSRVGIKAEADVVAETDNLIELFGKRNIWCNVIICDEAQFLTEKQVEQLKDIATVYDTDVICYGLRTDFKTKLFPGSQRLFELADKIVELNNVCDCGKPAMVNARIDSLGRVLVKGSQVDIGGDEKYKALCWSCYKKKIRTM